MIEINQSNWRQVVQRALDTDKPALAESIAREHGVGKKVNTNVCSGLLMDVQPFKANNGKWYLGVYVQMEGKLGKFTAPNGEKCSFIGELQHLKP